MKNAETQGLKATKSITTAFEYTRAGLDKMIIGFAEGLFYIKHQYGITRYNWDEMLEEGFSATQLENIKQILS